MTTEPNFAHCTYLEETWSFIDCPGSIELAQDVRSALMGVDVAVVVAPPEPARCLTLAPIFKLLDDHQIPHRSEEHTSELQSLMRISYAVFCLKKKINNKHKQKTHTRY